MSHGNDHDHFHDRPRVHPAGHHEDPSAGHLLRGGLAGRRTSAAAWVKRVFATWGWRRGLAGAVLLYLLAGSYYVPADQQAVVLRFGRVAEKRVQPGIHWTWPFPLGRVMKLKVWETKRLTVGVAAPDRVLGREVGEVKSQFLTGDQNILTIRLAVQYAIKDPVDYLFFVKDITALIAKSVEAALSDVAVRRKVDDLLTTEKVVVQQQVQASAQELLDRYRAGVHLSSVILESIAPPDEVLEAFRDVASAREDRERIQREADSYANDVVPRARGEAARLLEEAASYEQRTIDEALGDASRFTSLAAEYARARDVTGTRLFIETMEEVLPRMKKVLVKGNVDLDMIQRK